MYRWHRRSRLSLTKKIKQTNAQCCVTFVPDRATLQQFENEWNCVAFAATNASCLREPYVSSFTTSIRRWGWRWSSTKVSLAVKSCVKPMPLHLILTDRRIDYLRRVRVLQSVTTCQERRTTCHLSSPCSLSPWHLMPTVKAEVLYCSLFEFIRRGGKTLQVVRRTEPNRTEPNKTSPVRRTAV